MKCKKTKRQKTKKQQEINAVVYIVGLVLQDSLRLFLDTLASLDFKLSQSKLPILFQSVQSVQSIGSVQSIPSIQSIVGEYFQLEVNGIKALYLIGIHY